MVHFPGVAGESLAASAIQEESGGTCTLLVTIPAGAVTGTVTVDIPDGPKVDFETTFTTPCPDAGSPDTGVSPPPGTPPGTPPPPPLEYGGAFSVARGDTDSQFFATFFKAGTPSALAEERKIALDLVAPDGVAKGTCAKQPPVSGPPAPIDGADVGPVQLLAGGSVVATADPQTNGTSTGYNVLIPGTPAEVIANLADPANAKMFKPLPLPAPPSVTSPDVSSGVTVPSGSGFTLTYAPSTATNMALGLFKPPTIIHCVLDPAAGSFTVPASALPEAGSWSAALITGNVVSDELGGREVLGISNAGINFSVDVQ